MNTPTSPTTLLSTLFTALVLAGCGGGGGGGSRPPSNLLYSQAAPTYDLCGAITPNTPSSAGGAVTSYAIAPPLPAGLSFDTTTGVISGSPTAVAASAQYTVTASNAKGETDTTITLEVAHEVPAGLDYPELDGELGRGVFLRATPELSAGYGSTWTVSAGALPSGLTLDPSSGVISGVPTVAQNATFSITVEDCATATTFTNLAADVVPPYTRGALVLDSTSGLLRSFVRSPASGALLHHGRTFSASTSSVVALHPTSQFAFTAAGGVIRTFVLDTRTLEIGASTSNTSIGASAITDLVCTHDGLRLYACSVLGVIHSFSINASTGALTPTPTPTANSGTSPAQLVIDPNDEWLIVANSGDDTVGVYSIDGVDGDLALVGTSASSDGVRALALTSDGARLYAAGANSSTLHGFALNLGNGALSALGWGTANVTSTQISALALATDDATLYVGAENTGLIRAFTLDPGTGAPTAAAFANVTASENTRAFAVDPRGAHLYSTHDDGVLHTWSVAGNGALSASSVGVTKAAGDTSDLALVLGHGEWRSSTQSLYATSLASDGVWEFTFDSTSGALASVAGTPAATGINPQTVSIHPFAERAIVAHQSAGTSGALTAHRITSQGALASGVGAGETNSNVGFELDRSGDHGYLVQGTGASTRLVSYAFDTSTFALTSLGTSTFTSTPWPPAVHPSGSLVVVPDSGADQLDVFEIDPQTSLATYSNSVSTGGVDPFRAVFDPTGRFVFCAHIGSDSLSGFSVDLASGTLTPLAGSPFATTITPLAMTMSTGGAALLIADTALGEWAYYSVDQDPSNVADDGSLTLAGSGTQAGIALLRFDAEDEHVLWVLSGTNRLRSLPITAPGVLAAPVSDLAIGAQITSIGLRNR
jgi:6-phosphogluconolactonase (cycloisomerase 2 family)